MCHQKRHKLTPKPDLKWEDIQHRRLIALGRHEEKLPLDVFVCLIHFEENIFDHTFKVKRKLGGCSSKQLNIYRHLRPDKVPTIFKHKAVPKPRVKSVLRAEKRKHDEARYVTNECFTMSLLFKSFITALKTFQSLSLLRKHIKHFLSALCLTVSMFINFIALDSHTNCQKLSQTLRCFLVYSVLTLTNKLN